MKPKSGRSVDDLSRDYDDEAIEVFADIMRDPLAEHRDRLRAAENLIERGHGKAVTPIAVMPGGKKRDQLAAMTEDELYAIVRKEQLPRLTAPKDEVIDAEITSVDIWDDPLLQ